MVDSTDTVPVIASVGSSLIEAKALSTASLRPPASMWSGPSSSQLVNSSTPPAACSDNSSKFAENSLIARTMMLETTTTPNRNATNHATVVDAPQRNRIRRTGSRSALMTSATTTGPTMNPRAAAA